MIESRNVVLTHSDCVTFSTRTQRNEFDNGRKGRGICSFNVINQAFSKLCHLTARQAS